MLAVAVHDCWNKHETNTSEMRPASKTCRPSTCAEKMRNTSYKYTMLANHPNQREPEDGGEVGLGGQGGRGGGGGVKVIAKGRCCLGF